MNYNKVIQGDCLQVMRGFASESVDLVYMDPPFNSGRDYEGETGAFSDRFESMAHYVEFIRQRAVACFMALKPTGSLYLHCDASASHYLKVMLDEGFGVKNFVNEIIWSHQGSWAQPANRFPRRHDSILLYCKSPKYVFNEVFEDDAPKQEDYKRWKKYLVGNMIFAANMPAHDKRFKIHLDRFRERHGREPEGRDVVFELTGTRVGTVTHVKVVHPQSKENAKYPTQKPVALLKKLIESSSNPGDLVLDPFCGSGTTLVAAKQLNRKYIGIDISADACRLAESRVA